VAVVCAAGEEVDGIDEYKSFEGHRARGMVNVGLVETA
jgi:hypothetical protein